MRPKQSPQSAWRLLHRLRRFAMTRVEQLPSCLPTMLPLYHKSTFSPICTLLVKSITFWNGARILRLDGLGHFPAWRSVV